MAGTKAFDVDAVIERAIHQFWQHGYERTSLHDLLNVLDLSRSSFYNAFGDKRGLFVRVLEDYLKDYNEQPIITLLAKHDSGRAAIQSVFENVVTLLATDANCKGCLMVNSMIDVAPYDEEIARLIYGSIESLEAAFAQTLERAIAQGEISPLTDVQGTARFLVAVLNSLRAMGRLPHTHNEYQTIADVALSLLIQP